MKPIAVCCVTLSLLLGAAALGGCDADSSGPRGQPSSSQDTDDNTEPLCDDDDDCDETFPICDFRSGACLAPCWAEFEPRVECGWRQACALDNGLCFGPCADDSECGGPGEACDLTIGECVIP